MHSLYQWPVLRPFVFRNTAVPHHITLGTLPPNRFFRWRWATSVACPRPQRERCCCRHFPRLLLLRPRLPIAPPAPWRCHPHAASTRCWAAARTPTPVAVGPKRAWTRTGRGRLRRGKCDGRWRRERRLPRLPAQSITIIYCVGIKHWHYFTCTSSKSSSVASCPKVTLALVPGCPTSACCCCCCCCCLADSLPLGTCPVCLA